MGATKRREKLQALSTSRKPVLAHGARRGARRAHVGHGTAYEIRVNGTGKTLAELVPQLVETPQDLVQTA